LRCEVTEANNVGGIILDDADDTSILDCNIHGNETDGIAFDDWTDDTEISGCTITENEDDGILIDSWPQYLEITDCDITENEGDGIHINSWDATNFILFNNILDNEGDDLDDDTGDTVYAILNWWGTAVKADIGVAGDDVVYEPFLTGTTDTILLASAAATATDSLDAKTTVGVKVSGVEDDEDDNADLIAAAKYAENPQSTLADAVVFFDIFVAPHEDFDSEDASIRVRLYDEAIDAHSVAQFWTGDFWAECSEQTANEGVIYVTVTDDTIPATEELKGTPFAVVAVEAPPPAAPTITAPTPGATGVSLTPTFMWSAVEGAVTYELQVSDNPQFRGLLATDPPLVDRTGLPTNAYALETPLDYSTSYYWRVRGTTTEVGMLTQPGEAGEWSASIFTTMAEPEPEPEEWISPYTGQKFDSEAELLAHIEAWEAEHAPPEPTTPAYIWAIIAIGAVLVIVVVVLIVRTRRAV
jgi:parallel beta-helix repeat protein